ncbi:MAG: hypothetical protein AMXMBFR46_12470 [Acidimicrobiia bacterium]
MSDLTADRVDLRYLVEAYALGCDRRDPDLLASCFVDGATLTVHWLDREPAIMRAPDLATQIPRRLSVYDRTVHFVGNHRVEIDGDHATGETYCFAHHITGDEDHVMAVRYEDTYRREPTGWKIVERHLRLDWTQDSPVTR